MIWRQARTLAAEWRIGHSLLTASPDGKQRDMIELIRTNDAVVISFVEALLRDAGIEVLVADQNMSIVEGSIGILARRILVRPVDEALARQILADAGIGDEMRNGQA